MSLIDTPNGVTMQWLMDDKVDDRAGASLAKMTVSIGVTSEKHHHTNCTETIHVLDGQIEQSIGPKIQTLSAGETCLIPMGISCLLYTSPSPRDKRQSRMPSSA